MLIESYFNFYKTSGVAQYNNKTLLINELNNLLEDIDYIIHSNPPLLTPLFYLKQRTLDLKLHVLKEIKIDQPKKETQEQKKSVVVIQNKLSPNKEKIVNFIKKSDRIRAKDIVEEFSSLSERTIQRTLKDLTEMGIVKKEEAQDRAVFYSLR